MSEKLVTGVARQGERLSLNVRSAADEGSKEEIVGIDAVVAGIGIWPNVHLAEQAGLSVDDGIAVDELLRSGNPDIYAAGDVSNFYNPSLNARIRLEHEDNALTMGKYAGRNMAGKEDFYHHLPYFYSDLFDLGYEAVGLTDSRLETVADWVEPYKKGVVYYMQDGRVRGVLLWNVWERVDAARDLIAQPGPIDIKGLKGKFLS
nr:FAD-dependent oxidoreductase [Methylomarinum sp. Ch1-1]MDP4520195.1 FAD-dependent oxidoreductase [Methylomarinum sp. Ch1-1]